MDKTLYQKIIRYRTSVAIIKEMCLDSLITDEEYGMICTNLAERFGLKPSTLYSDIDLISLGRNGNIGH